MDLGQSHPGSLAEGAAGGSIPLRGASSVDSTIGSTDLGRILRDRRGESTPGPQAQILCAEMI